MPRLIPGSRTSDPPLGVHDRHDELAALAVAVTRGDRAAVRTFLTVIVPHLLRVARLTLGTDHPDLEDVTYEAAYAVVDALPRFRREGTVLHFACRVAVLTAMNARRREHAHKRARLRDDEDPDVMQSDDIAPDDRALSSSLAPIVRELLAELPEALGEALALHVVLGYTVGEIATASGAPIETVRSRLRLAKQALRRRVLGHPKLREAVEGEP